MSKHRAEVRPRWGRIGLTAAAATVVVIAIAGGAGAFSHSGDATTANGSVAVQTSPVAAVPTSSGSVAPSATATASGTPGSAGASSDSAPGSAGPSATARRTSAAPSSSAPKQTTPSSAAPSGSSAADVALPPASGTGRRAVFSQSEQRVWIVDSDGTVERTYLVSGSVEDNLRPGTYAVYSRSRYAVGIEDSGRMQYFVRFAHGTDSGAAIGFHSIPVKDGSPLQSVAQLGTPRSHGCIRQKTADAIAMWNFAQDGTKVVVVA